MLAKPAEVKSRDPLIETEMEPAFSIIVMVTVPAEAGLAKQSRSPTSTIPRREGCTEIRFPDRGLVCVS